MTTPSTADRRRLDVAVIGAGPSGLVTAKELLAVGHRVRVYERAPDLGGVFRFDPDPEQASAWETCRLTSSILVTSFSDHFPDAGRDEPYEHRHWTRVEYIDYLRSYVERFGLDAHIAYNTAVVDVDPIAGSGRWVVQTRTGGGDDESREFDALAVCSGLHGRPSVPDLPGLGSFRGRVLHSAHYKGSATDVGSAVLFVGLGESGSEIVGEVAPRVERASLSVRRGVYMLPRFVGGVPNDYNGTRFLYSLPDFVARRTDDGARQIKLRLARRAGPLMRVRRALVRRFSHDIEPDASTQAESTSAGAVRVIDLLKRHAGGNLFETFATKTAAAAEAIAAGDCDLRPQIVGITPLGAVFADGTSGVYDTIMLCTGWDRPTVPWVDRLGVDTTALWRHVIAPQAGPTLAFIGHVRPPVGAIPPMSEMQARWWARTLTGEVALPDAPQMTSDIADDADRRRAYHHRVIDRVPNLVDFSAHLDLLADDLGVKPSGWRVLHRPRLLYQLHAAPFCGAQYRLRGPGAEPELAKRVLGHAPHRLQGLRVFDALATSIGARLGVAELRPRLTIWGRARPVA